MNRAEVQDSLSAFFDRAACANVADLRLVSAYRTTLQEYIARLEEDFDPIDEWSVGEYERVCEYIGNNRQWITEAEDVIPYLVEARDAFEKPKKFLEENGILPAYLRSRPNSALHTDATRQ